MRTAECAPQNATTTQQRGSSKNESRRVMEGTWAVRTGVKSGSANRTNAARGEASKQRKDACARTAAGYLGAAAAPPSAAPGPPPVPAAPAGSSGADMGTMLVLMTCLEERPSVRGLRATEACSLLNTTSAAGQAARGRQRAGVEEAGRQRKALWGEEEARRQQKLGWPCPGQQCAAVVV